MDNFFKVTPRKRSVKIKSKQGVIYNNPCWWRKWLFYLGTVTIFFSVGALGYIYQPLMKSWITYKAIDQEKIVEKVSVAEQEIKSETNIEIEKKSDEFNIEVPKIGANAKIIKGVSPYNKKEYMEVLKGNDIAQSSISSLPGDGKGTTTYLFAHSTQQELLAARQNSVFYLLGELNNDDVILINYKGKDYMYKVYTKKIIGAKEVEYLTYSEKDRELLVLQTCWPIGTNWQRLLIFAERI